MCINTLFLNMFPVAEFRLNALFAIIHKDVPVIRIKLILRYFLNIFFNYFLNTYFWKKLRLFYFYLLFIF